jgi:hypothetical protein
MQPMTTFERHCLENVAWMIAVLRDESNLYACQFLMGIRGRAPLDNEYRDYIVWC